MIAGLGRLGRNEAFWHRPILVPERLLQAGEAPPERPPADVLQPCVVAHPRLVEPMGPDAAQERVDGAPTDPRGGATQPRRQDGERVPCRPVPPALSLNGLVTVADRPWAEQMELVFERSL